MTGVVTVAAKEAVIMAEMAAIMRSKSHWLPATGTAIQEKAAGEGRGGDWVGYGWDRQ